MGRGRVGLEVNRFDVYLVTLGRTRGSEIQKTRPCLVVSPDEMNHHIRTVIVAPMTTKGQSYPTRVPCRFKGKGGQIVLDQLRTVDKARLVRPLGRLDPKTGAKALAVLAELFAPQRRRSRPPAVAGAAACRPPRRPSTGHLSSRWLGARDPRRVGALAERIACHSWQRLVRFSSPSSPSSPPGFASIVRISIDPHQNPRDGILDCLLHFEFA